MEVLIVVGISGYVKYYLVVVGVIKINQLVFKFCVFNFIVEFNVCDYVVL